MPARLISVPFLILLAIFAWLTLEKDESYSLYLIFLVVILASIYTLSPQINWWWYRKNPPDVDPEIRKLLIQHLPFYNQLRVEDKERFRNRMALYMMAVEFIPKGWEQLPEDIKAVIGANAVQLTFGQEDFLLPDYERIAIYTTPFPSPQYPDTLHTSEIFPEDGVLLFSAPQLMAGFLQPTTHYNIVLHEYIKVFQQIYPSKNYPVEKEIEWPVLEKISRFPRQNIEATIGIPDISPVVVSGVLFFTHSESFSRLAPKLFQQWQMVFKYNSLSPTH